MGDLRAPRRGDGWRGALAALCAGGLVACGGGAGGPTAGPRAEAPAPPEGPTEASLTVVETILGDPAPASAAGEVAGAAAPLPERPVPEDIVPLAERMVPRRLPIPPTARGAVASFTFDRGRHGWLARVPGGGRALLTPTYHEGRVFVGGGFSSSQFFAYDARSGTPLWAMPAPAGGPTAAVVADGKLLFNTESCTLYALDVGGGEQVWSRWLGDPLMSQPAAGDGMVYSGHVIDGRSPGRIRPEATGWGVGGGRRYGFTALRLDDGRPRWTTRIDADVMNAPVLADRAIFFSTMNGVLYHLDRRSGRVRWRREVEATSAPWLHGDEILVTARTSDHEREHTLVLDQRRGEIQRHFDAVDAGFLHERADHGGVAGGWSYEGSRPTVHGDRMYQTIGNEVHCRDASTGALIWRRAYTEDASSRPASPPAIAGSQLVFGTREGALYGLEVDGGLTTFAYDVGEPIAAQPTIAHGWVYAGTERGALVGLELGDPTLDGWHMWGGNAAHGGPTLGTTSPWAALEEGGAGAPGGARPTEGTLRLDDEPNHGDLGGFPLERTEVSAEVRGFVARVTVEQTFTHPYDRPVAATYRFPLPEGAAVERAELRSGDRVVRARIVARPPADASVEDHQGAIVQARPDVFEVPVTGLAPEETVRVRLVYAQALPYEGGGYALGVPLRAGPRYTRATGDGYNPAGTPLELALGPEDARPDAVAVALDTRHAEVRSETHALEVTAGEGGTRAVIDGDAPPDRDFAARFPIAGEEPEAVVIASPPADPGERGTFALALHPRLEVPPDEISPRELAMVIDTSSSMRGPALAHAQAAARRLIAGLRPEDRFRVVVLDDSTRAIEGGPGDAGRAEAFLRDLGAEGPTGARDGLMAALTAPLDPARLRFVVLMSDGFLGHEPRLLGEVRERLGASRFFALGLGGAVDDYLLERLAEMGRGAFLRARLDAPPEDTAARLEAHVARPALTDLAVDWGTLAAEDVYPRRLPDLFADRPLVLHGRYAAGGTHRVVLRGRIAGRAFRQVLDVTLPAEGAPRPELAAVWARARIDDVRTATRLAPDPTLEAEAARLAAAHGVLNEWTTFVVEDSVEPEAPVPAASTAAAPPITGRPSTDPEGPRIRACYASSRDDDGTVDPDRLARCLAE